MQWLQIGFKMYLMLLFIYLFCNKKKYFIPFGVKSFQGLRFCIDL